MAGVDLGKQVGPLPLGAWFAVVGTGLAIAYYSRNAQSGEPVIVDDTGSPDGVGTGVKGNWIDVTPPDPVDTPDDDTPTDNDAWGRKVIDELTAQGYDAAVVQSAIAKALQGAPLSASEWTLWKFAIARFGAPPYPLDVVPSQIPISKPHTPTKKPPPKKTPPKRNRIYMIKRGDTLASISKKMYGNVNHANAIFNANKKGAKRRPYLANPGFLVSGDRGKPGLRHVGRNLLIP